MTVALTCSSSWMTATGPTTWTPALGLEEEGHRVPLGTSGLSFSVRLSLYLSHPWGLARKRQELRKQIPDPLRGPRGVCPQRKFQQDGTWGCTVRSIFILRSHPGLPGPLAQGNEAADVLAAAVLALPSSFRPYTPMPAAFMRIIISHHDKPGTLLCLSCLRSRMWLELTSEACKTNVIRQMVIIHITFI